MIRTRNISRHSPSAVHGQVHPARFFHPKSRIEKQKHQHCSLEIRFPCNSARFWDDEAIKELEALRTLSDLYVTPVPATGTLKGKEVQHDVDELEDDGAKDDMMGIFGAID